MAFVLTQICAVVAECVRLRRGALYGNLRNRYEYLATAGVNEFARRSIEYGRSSWLGVKTTTRPMVEFEPRLVRLPVQHEALQAHSGG